MARVSEADLSFADLFDADLMGIRRRPRRRTAVVAPAEAVIPAEDAPDGSISAGEVFDGVVHRGMSPEALLGYGETWDVAALPRSATPLPDMPSGALVVQRALGEQRLGSMRVLGQDVEARELYGEDGLIRPDVLVLRPRTTSAPADRSMEPEPAEDTAEWSLGSFFRPWGRIASFPARPSGATGGRAFMETIKGEADPRDWGARENAIVSQLVSGNMPDSLLTWIKIDLAYKDSTRDLKGSVEVLPDYLAVGSDSDYVHVPLDPVSAQLVADKLDAILPTARICHAIYKQTAEKNRINAIERDYWQQDGGLRRSAKPGRTQASTSAYLEHSEAIQAKMKSAGISLGELVAGHKKDVVIARRLLTDVNKVAFHGFYDSKGYPHEPCYENPDRRPKPSCDKDSPTVAHHRRFSDYSQGVRLVNPWMVVNGERKKVADVLADKYLSPLVSSEGPIVPPRIPNTTKPAGSSSESAVDTLSEVDVPTGRLPEAWEFQDREEEPVSLPAPEYAGVEDTEDSGAAEAVPRGGRGAFRHDPLGGDAGENVEARFNVDASTTSGSTIDIVVYLHGYGYLEKGETQRGFVARKAREAGLDVLDSAGAVRRRTTSPTLVLIPRGRHDGGRGWFFHKLLPDRVAFDALVNAGVKWLCDTVLGLPSGSTLTRGRLTLMAHSGGGAGMAALMSGSNRVDPDEVVCFDSLYGGEVPIREWALARIKSAAAAKSGLRVFYTGCGAPSTDNPSGRWVLRQGKYVLEDTGAWTYSGGWSLQTTEPYARRVHEALQSALRSASGGAALADRFRVQRTWVGHSDIPMQYSPFLLDDIAATLPKTAAPPARTSRPVCVSNDDWLTDGVRMRKPGGDAPPPPKPAPPPTPTPKATGEVAIEDAERTYDAPDRRAFSPSTSATLFRTPPNPVAVTPATVWPETTSDADRVTERALRALGVDSAGIAAFSGAGMTAMRPIASAFGEPALVELLRRLRYTADQLARPPHSFGGDAAVTRAFGRAVARSVILAIRTLLAIPGHFRQLARQAGNEHDAYAVENLGWLLMQSLRDDVRSASGLQFWLPAPPAFVTAFADPVPGLSLQTERLIVGRMLVDTTLDAGEYQRRYQLWKRGPAGRSWRLETGRETVAGRPAGAPFYPEAVSIPSSIDFATERAQVEAAWTRRLADVDAGRTTVPLARCDNAYLTQLRVMSQVSLRGLQLRWQFPSPVSAPAPSSLTGLAAVQPAFEAAFQAIVDLGWNDLVFETQGLLCFRGMKVPGRPAAARRMSNHSLGTAVDLNVFENQQNTPGSMDPRIVALFEAFRFRWVKAFAIPEPRHFEYAG